MRKNYGPKTWLYSMPVLPDPITYDSAHHTYPTPGAVAGKTFEDGAVLK